MRYGFFVNGQEAEFNQRGFELGDQIKDPDLRREAGLACRQLRAANCKFEKILREAEELQGGID
jgi:hypothetical protein